MLSRISFSVLSVCPMFTLSICVPWVSVTLVTAGDTEGPAALRMVGSLALWRNLGVLASRSPELDIGCAHHVAQLSVFVQDQLDSVLRNAKLHKGGVLILLDLQRVQDPSMDVCPLITVVEDSSHWEFVVFDARQQDSTSYPFRDLLRSTDYEVPYIW
jgi:hypothetical protein